MPVGLSRSRRHRRPPECLPKVACSRLLPPQVFDMFDKDGKPA